VQHRCDLRELEDVVEDVVEELRKHDGVGSSCGRAPGQGTGHPGIKIKDASMREGEGDSGENLNLKALLRL
jgi:hypothetical protein